ncbi:DUF4142 domain-containing protein [Sphingosinithalassobacter sp. LHW66-3]|uniref:DUF4142 domain-containing protein n=1 Tax=Sphingosinithalassobacter sp. LHW66-3 TaxID=3424718 RepID=UPI003D6B20CC
MKRLALLAAAAAMPLAACTSNGMMGMNDGQMPAGTPMSDMTPTEAMPYVTMAGASDLYEIESSRLALQKSQNPQIREFAQMMIDHHTLTTNTVMAAARQAGMNPPAPSLMPMQRQMLDELRGMTGAAFERTYLMQQRRAHDMALTLHRTYSERGDSMELRQAANSAVPLIERHIAALRTMNM